MTTPSPAACWPQSHYRVRFRQRYETNQFSIAPLCRSRLKPPQSAAACRPTSYTIGWGHLSKRVSIPIFMPDLLSSACATCGSVGLSRRYLYWPVTWIFHTMCSEFTAKHLAHIGRGKLKEARMTPLCSSSPAAIRQLNNKIPTASAEAMKLIGLFGCCCMCLMPWVKAKTMHDRSIPFPVDNTLTFLHSSYDSFTSYINNCLGNSRMPWILGAFATKYGQYGGTYGNLLHIRLEYGGTSLASQRNTTTWRGASTIAPFFLWRWGMEGSSFRVFCCACRETLNSRTYQLRRPCTLMQITQAKLRLQR